MKTTIQELPDYGFAYLILKRHCCERYSRKLNTRQPCYASATVVTKEHLGLVLLVMACACSSPSSIAAPPASDAQPAGDSGNQVLQIVPDPAVIHLVDGVAPQQSFEAYFRYADGTRRNVTRDVSWELSSDALGTLSGPTFTASTASGGRITLTARMDSYFGLAEIQVSETFLRQGVGVDELARFPLDEASAINPILLHPENESMLPPNLHGVEWIFRTQSHSSFELRFWGPGLELREYFHCRPLDGPCLHPIALDIWRRISAGGRAGTQISYKLRALGAEGRTALGATETRTFTLSEEAIEGGIYYWDGGAGDILRYEFGSDSDNAELFLDGLPGSPDTCIGCHSFARDGSRLSVITSDTIGTRVGLTTLRTEDRSIEVEYPTRTGRLGNYWALSPDGSQLATVTAEGLIIRDPADSSVRQSFSVPRGSMAAFSEDGESIAYSRATDSDTETEPQRALGWIRRDADREWNFSRDLLSPNLEAGSVYAPDWSPGSTWIASIRSARTDSRYGAPAGLISLVNTDTGEEIMPEALGDGTENFPRWDPSPYLHREESLFWLVYSSRRELESLLMTTPRAQLWLTSFRPERIAEGESPLSPPIHLPFQDWNRDCLMGRLVTHIQRKPCDEDPDCPSGERCLEGVCRPIVD